MKILILFLILIILYGCSEEIKRPANDTNSNQEKLLSDENVKDKEISKKVEIKIRKPKKEDSKTKSNDKKDKVIQLPKIQTELEKILGNDKIIKSIPVDDNSFLFLLEKVEKTPKAPFVETDGYWILDTETPIRILKIFDTLKIKKQYSLIGYYFFDGFGGHGSVIAIPNTFNKNDLSNKVKGKYDYHIEQHVSQVVPITHFMDAIEGDRSVWSYISASIFYHEAIEYGAAEHFCDWYAQKVIVSDLFKKKQYKLDKNDYEWHYSEPESWNPEYYVTKNGRIIFSFYSYSQYLGNCGIYKYIHIFDKDKYNCKMKEIKIADGGGTYMVQGKNSVFTNNNVRKNLQSKNTFIKLIGEIKVYNKLTQEEESVIIHKGTERPFSGKYNILFENGVYICKRCNAELYISEDKFSSSCGWPSFDDEVSGAIKKVPDKDGSRTEILCANCDAHLGHIFYGEGMTKKNVRHCVNSISLNFIPEGKTEKTQTAIYAGGCFWGIEYHFKKAKGVISTEVGYIGGHKENPTYREVCDGYTGHAEALKVEFDPDITSFEKLTKLFFEIHDPTQLNRQGPDIGEQYRSVIFFTNDEQKIIAEQLIKTLINKGYNVVTELKPAKTFWKAEEYHQLYYFKKNEQPYCHIYTRRF